MDFKRINWLASFPKSGSTWVRCFLDAYHLGELDINDLLCSIPDNRVTRHDYNGRNNPAKLPHEMQLLTRNMSNLRAVMEHLDSQTSIPMVMKTHSPIRIVDGVELMPPRLSKSVVHVYRNPLDVVGSFAKHFGHDIESAAAIMAREHFRLLGNEGKMMDYIGAWGQHTRSFVNAPGHNVLHVKYEDLREKPASGFASILRHIGITNPDPVRIAKALELTELSKLRKTEREQGFEEASAKNKEGFFGQGRTDGGKNLTASQRGLIKGTFASDMKRLGYL